MAAGFQIKSCSKCASSHLSLPKQRLLLLVALEHGVAVVYELCQGLREDSPDQTPPENVALPERVSSNKG